MADSRLHAIHENLRHVTRVMWRNVTALLRRGEHVDVTEEAARQLLWSSETFVQRVTPWYRRCYDVLEYYTCYCCTRERIKGNRRNV